MSMTQVGAAESDAIQDALGGASSVLVLTSGGHSEAQPCSTLIGSIDVDQTNLLCVTLEETPDQHLDRLRSQLGQLPSNTGIIAVGEQTRSASASQSTGSGISGVSIDTVADPSDLTGIAMAIGAYLDSWSNSDRPTAVCFNSITSLLFHAEQERVFRFLHSTTGRLRDLGAVAHYHLNPEAFDRSTVNSFSALFDAVVELDAEDSVTVRTRR